jgi:hypothetical protein
MRAKRGLSDIHEIKTKNYYFNTPKIVFIFFIRCFYS